MLVRLYLICVIVLYCTSQSFCQTVVNATGAYLKNNTYSIDYSVGEISIETISTQNNVKINFLTQGLLQPSVKVVNPACEIINDSLQYFPNPGHEKINIVGTYNWISNYAIYDAAGRLMSNSPFYNNSIDLSRLANGVYFIVLYPGCDNHFKTIKIMKQ